MDEQRNGTPSAPRRRRAAVQQTDMMNEQYVQAQPEVQQEVPEIQDEIKQKPGKGAAFMNRIDVEISAPLSGTSSYVKESIPNVFEEPASSVGFDEELDVPRNPTRMPD